MSDQLPAFTAAALNLLDRHIFKSVLFTCLGAVGLFAFVVALANFIRDLLGPLLAGQIDTWMLARLIFLLFPYVIIYALPMGILTGVLLTLGRLSADSEITAMRAAGIGVTRAAFPVFILAAIGSGVALYANFESMPWSRVQYHREFSEAMRQNPLSFIVPKTFIRDFKGWVVHVGDRPAGGQILRDIWVWQLDKQGRVTRAITAQSGKIDYDESDLSLVITLYGTQSEERDPNNPEDFSKSPKAPSIQKWEKVRLPVDSYLGRDALKVKPEWLTYDQLQAKRASVAAETPAPGQEKEAARSRMKLALILHEKWNLSLAVFAFAFVAVPLGIRVSRRETSANLGVAVLLVLSYYVLITMVKWLDRHPEYRPDILLWVPNLLFIGYGLWLLRRVQRQ